MNLKVENDSSWDFWDAFDKTSNRLNDIGKDSEKYSEPGFKDAIEKALLGFLIRLPAGDYSNLIKEFYERV